MKINKIILSFLVLLLTGCEHEDIIILKNKKIGLHNFTLHDHFDTVANVNNIQYIKDGYITYLINDNDLSRTFISIPFAAIIDKNKATIKKIGYFKNIKCNNIINNTHKKLIENSEIYKENDKLLLYAGDENIVYDDYYIEMTCDNKNDILTILISGEKEFTSTEKMKFNKFLENKIIKDFK